MNHETWGLTATATATSNVDMDFDDQRLHDRAISMGGFQQGMFIVRYSSTLSVDVIVDVAVAVAVAAHVNAHAHAHVTASICDD
jgi:hypothetical protein